MRTAWGLMLVGAAVLGCSAPRSRARTPAAAPIASPPAVAAAPAPAPAAEAAAPPAATPAGTPNGPSGGDIVGDECTTCHTEDLLRQQRLTDAQWTKTLDKMRRWGAPTDPQTLGTLTAYLAAAHGPASGPFTPESIPAQQATALFEPRPDGPFAGGDRERGLALYGDRCLSCHEQNGRGGDSGVNLVGRQILDRAAEFAAVIRTGRGSMPEFPETTDPEAADLLAYLRSLK